MQDTYAAFGRGDIETILNSTTEDVSSEFETPAVLSWSGIREGRQETRGLFPWYRCGTREPGAEHDGFFSTDDAVAAFGRYDVTVKSTGKRVSTPVGHYFKFRDGKVSRFVNLTNSGAFWEAAKQS